MSKEHIQRIPGSPKKVSMAFLALVLCAAAGLSATISYLKVDPSPSAPNTPNEVMAKLLTLPDAKVKKENAKPWGLTVNGVSLGSEEHYIDVQVPPGQSSATLEVGLWGPAAQSSGNKVLLAAEAPAESIRWGEGKYLSIEGLKEGQYRMAVRQLVLTKNINTGDERHLFTQSPGEVVRTIGGCLNAQGGCVLAVSAPQYMGPIQKTQWGHIVQSPQSIGQVIYDERAAILQKGKEAILVVALGALLAAVRLLPSVSMGKKDAILSAKSFRV